MPYLHLIGITKYFPGIVANDGIDFEVEEGEIHALVGENGAGKSTLMRIVYGMERPDAGRILLKGKPISIANPQMAIRLGIDMVHQHFELVRSMSVAENVTLGYEPHRGPFVDRKAMNAQVAELSERFGLRIDPAAVVSDLSVGVQQRVEILKLLYRNARLLILDEPSAVLTPQEVEDLFDVLRRLVAEGRTAIFITHKLHEVMSVCQRATVLQRGRVVGTVKVAETRPETIARMMVGHEVVSVQRQISSRVMEKPLLTVHDLKVEDDRGLPAVRGVSFGVRSGEIVGLAGVEGNGQRELLEALVGLRAPKQGDILINQAIVTRARNRRRREVGLAVIPEDRTRQGLSLPSTLTENLMSTRYYRAPFSRWGVLQPAQMRQFSRCAIRRFDIRVRGPNVHAKTLSGGNAQKVVVARELAEPPKVLIAAQPTRGLDVGATEFVHGELLRLRAAGTAILLVSADLDELMALSDRYLVMFEGSLVGEIDGQDATRELLGILMAGKTSE